MFLHEPIRQSSFGWKFQYPAKKFYSCRDAARFLKLSRDEVYLRRKGKLLSTEIQGMFFFTKPALVNWIRENQPHRLPLITLGEVVRKMPPFLLNFLLWFIK